MKLFKIDSALYTIFTLIFDLILLNILWIICSIPIITTGPSTTALYFVCGKIVRKEDYRVLRDYFKSYKLNFKQGVVIGIIQTVALLFIGYNIIYLYMNKGLSRVVLALEVILFIELLIVFIYTLPILSRLEIKTKDLFPSAFYIGNRHMLTSIIVIGICLLTGYITYFVPGLLFIISISLSSLMIYYVMRPILDKYIKE